MVTYLPPEPLTFHVGYLIAINFIMFLKEWLMWCLQKLAVSTQFEHFLAEADHQQHCGLTAWSSIAIERSVDTVISQPSSVDISNSSILHNAEIQVGPSTMTTMTTTSGKYRCTRFYFYPDNFNTFLGTRGLQCHRKLG